MPLRDTEQKSSTMSSELLFWESWAFLASLYFCATAIDLLTACPTRAASVRQVQGHSVLQSQSHRKQRPSTAFSTLSMRRRPHYEFMQLLWPFIQSNETGRGMEWNTTTYMFVGENRDIRR